MNAKTLNQKNKIMNENLNLVEILKDCPKGTKLYSPICGEVEFAEIISDIDYAIKTVSETAGSAFFNKKGQYFVEGECMLFPSKDQRDWSKFQPKKPKFNPKTLQPFDRVLVRDNNDNSESWRCDLFSHIDNGVYRFICVGDGYHYCIPYNEETKHLVGTNYEAPEFYRYWED